jgi:hypothetical protein
LSFVGTGQHTIDETEGGSACAKEVTFAMMTIALGETAEKLLSKIDMRRREI